MLRTLFWNSDEARLRAMWRLLIQFVVLAAAVLTAFKLLDSAPALVVVAVELALTLLVTALATRFLDRRRFAILTDLASAPRSGD